MSTYLALANAQIEAVAVATQRRAMNPHVVQETERRVSRSLHHQDYVDTAAMLGVDLYGTDAPFQPAPLVDDICREIAFTEWQIKKNRRMMAEGWQLQWQVERQESDLAGLRRRLAELVAA